MSSKRSNNAIWKIALRENVSPEQRLRQILSGYENLVDSEPSKYKPLSRIPLRQGFEGIRLDLYIRTRPSYGFSSFLNGYLETEDDAAKFSFTSKDICLFIVTPSSLFVITSGSGYRIIEGFVDYNFPFDTAKKLVANNFQAADTREFSGATTSRTETYRRGYSISNSESFGKVWKRLVGRINTGLLPGDSYLREIINTEKPPAIEVKSSFTLKKCLDLAQIVSLVGELESLPEPSEEQIRQLSFLDNLYPVRNKDLRDNLLRSLVESLRQEATGGPRVDLDICDPDDVPRYYAGSNFRVARYPIEGDPPEKDDLISAIRQECQQELNDGDAFYAKIEKLKLRYSVNEDDKHEPEEGSLTSFMHGQTDYDGETFFLLDRTWYRSQGQFLDRLKKDFIDEVFNASPSILNRQDLSILEWTDADEDAFNKRQAAVDRFYYGDKIFAFSERGQIELFDLLRVDTDRLYVIHVKDDFDAKMRDACSQITVASEIIESDRQNGKVLLSAYYDQWINSDINNRKAVSRETFLGWFDLPITYGVLCSTHASFTARTFESNVLYSHIARREIIATNVELKGHGLKFELLHTPRR